MFKRFTQNSLYYSCLKSLTRNKGEWFYNIKIKDITICVPDV